MSDTITRGMIFIHSSPSALCPHVQWAIGAVLDRRLDFDWAKQPAFPGVFRAELVWEATPGTGAALASALRGWSHLRYEITEEPSLGVDGSRWSYTPTLGIFHAMTDVCGNVVVSENRIRHALENGVGDSARLYYEMALATGKAWDDELETFRHASEGASVRWLNQVG